MTKIGIVRKYLNDTGHRVNVDYDRLYKLAIANFEDWRSTDKNTVIGYLRTYVGRVGKEGFSTESPVELLTKELSSKAVNEPKIKTKKGLVRKFLSLSGDNERVDYDQLYHAATDQFQDWKDQSKEQVIRWLKQYVYQINIEHLENEDASLVEKDMSEDDLEASEPVRKLRKAKSEKIQLLGHDLIKGLESNINIAIEKDEDAYFLLNRFIWVRLRMHEDKLKKVVKATLSSSYGLACANCDSRFRHTKKLHLHRININKTYSIDNCQLLCADCHVEVHSAS